MISFKQFLEAKVRHPQLIPNSFNCGDYLWANISRLNDNQSLIRLGLFVSELVYGKLPPYAVEIAESALNIIDCYLRSNQIPEDYEEALADILELAGDGDTQASVAVWTVQHALRAIKEECEYNIYHAAINAIHANHDDGILLQIMEFLRHVIPKNSDYQFNIDNLSKTKLLAIINKPFHEIDNEDLQLIQALMDEFDIDYDAYDWDKIYQNEHEKYKLIQSIRREFDPTGRIK